MAIRDLFSKRRSVRPTKLKYDAVPEGLRRQCVMILKDAFGSYPEMGTLDKVLLREHPTPSFPPSFGDMWSPAAPLPWQFILLGSLDECLDAIELAFGTINTHMRPQPPPGYSAEYPMWGAAQWPDDAINELNARFLEHGVGYQFSPDQNHVVRIDSEFLHAEAVEPAAKLLREPGFEGAADEFAEAHKHYRAGEGKQAIHAASKAMESTAKAICDAKRWTYPKNATAVPLLKLLFEKGLVPRELESHFAGLRTAIESGLPTIGNAFARHGQGSAVKAMPDHLVALGMHLCAATIVFLVRAHKTSR